MRISCYSTAEILKKFF